MSNNDKNKKTSITFKQKLESWSQTHLRCLKESLDQLLRSPVSSILTIAVIAIALALPAGLSLLLNNLDQMTGSMDSTNTISLYLKSDIDEDQIEQLERKITASHNVGEISYISSEQALEEFRETSGQGKLIELLGDNPLPAVLNIQPAPDELPGNLEILVENLQQYPEVELAQFDSHWSRRLHAIVQLLNKVISVLSILLIASVLLIIGNTIRVGIQHRVQEIQISRLFGATNSFIRRPFLYSGLLYGLLGGIFASLLLIISYALLAESIQQLINSYDLGLQSNTTSFLKYCLMTIVGGAILGVISSWMVVYLYQKDLENSDFS